MSRFGTSPVQAERDGTAPPALLRLQRKNHLIVAVVLLFGLALHCAVTRSLPPPLIGSQLLASAFFALMGVGVGAGWVPLKWAGTSSGLVGMATFTVFVHLTGGPQSAYFPVFMAVPLVLAMFSPDSRLPTLAGGLASLGSAMIVNVLAQVPPSRMVLQAVNLSTFVGLALLGSSMYRRMLDTQRQAHQERLEALAQLAESERLRGHAERERAEVERLVLVGQLAAGVAHEVNNPLAYVKANLSHLLREGRGVDPDELMLVLSETQQGVLRIQQIVTDLRGFSRVGTLEENERGFLEEALSEATRLASMRLRESGAVALALEPGLPAVRLGQRHIVQVVLNLLLNAVDAVEMAMPGTPVRICVRAWRVEEGVRLEVEDNGPGIPPEVLPRLFEPFFTTKPPGKGTGLGLALCREYVSRVGGSLHAENPPGGGARFVLLLPVAPEPVPART